MKSVLDFGIFLLAGAVGLLVMVAMPIVWWNERQQRRAKQAAVADVHLPGKH